MSRRQIAAAVGGLGLVVALVAVAVLALGVGRGDAGDSTPSPTTVNGVPVADDSTEATDATDSALPGGYTDEQQRQAIAATEAQKFMVAYARPATAAAQASWWNGVLVYLAPPAERSLKIDPSQVPFTAVRGAPTVVGTQYVSQTPRLPDVLVRVQTDHGAWRVRMTNTYDTPKPVVLSAQPD